MRLSHISVVFRSRMFAVLLETDLKRANELVRDAISLTRAVQRDSRVLLSLYVPNDHLFALYGP
jgi:hypothetical protein